MTGATDTTPATHATTFERVLALTAIPALSDLHADDLASLAARTGELRTAPGEDCAQGRGRVLHLLLSGRLELGPQRRPVDAPALVGAVEMLAGSDLAVRAAGGGAHCLTLDREALGWVMADVYEVWVAMLRHTALRWVSAEALTADGGRVPPPAAAGSSGSLVTRMRLLSRADLLGGLRAYTLARVASRMRELRLSEGAALWEEGAPSYDCFVTLDGGLRRIPEPRAPALPVAAGTVLGLGEALARTSRSGRVVASSRARVLLLSAEVLIDELEDDLDAAAALLEALARRVLRAESRRAEAVP